MKIHGKIGRFFFLPALTGMALLLSVISTCERFPEPELEVSTDTIIVNSDQRTYQVIGSIRSFGRQPVSEHGFCWDESPDPTVTGNATGLGKQDRKGTFSSVIGNLPASTSFYVRAYAIAEEGTKYGEQLSFTTPAPGLPVITTAAVTGITEDAAQSGGVISDDGGDSVTARGVCWSTGPAPSTADSHTADGSGTGTFTSALTGLSCSTKYYVRAYATNSAGTGYGDTVSFITSQCSVVQLPTVSTLAATSVTTSSAVLNGNVTSDGGAAVTDRGFYFGTASGELLTLGAKIIRGTGPGTFNTTVDQLTQNTTYYFITYATNSAGTSYGEELSFTTSGSSGETVTDYDGNVYQTVQIGDQLWMKENLEVTHYADGTAIPHVSGTSAWMSLGTDDQAYCWYDNEDSLAGIYGALYSWPAAVNGTAGSDLDPSGIQGVCPDNWHLPSDAEWKELERYLGMSQVDADALHYRGADEGGKLKETGTSHWEDPNTGATNESGFSALPGGYRNDNAGLFLFLGTFGYWWTSAEEGSEEAWYRSLQHDRSDTWREKYFRNLGMSVRCVKDDAVPTLATVTTSVPTDITDSSALGGGEVVSDGGSAVVAYGVCWGKSQNPTTVSNDGMTVEGSGTGSFTSLMDHLDCNTTYYVRAYALNSVGTAYGQQEEFATSECPVAANYPPTVTTDYLSNTTTNSSECGGEVTDDGGGTVTARGLCWSTSPGPMVSDFTTNEGTGAGSFTSTITGLTKSTTYYVRAYATNSKGPGYGEQRILRTYEDSLADYDGNQYWTVMIGDQKWMAENLRVTHFADGTAVPLVESAHDWDNLTHSMWAYREYEKAYCWYDNSAMNADVYGGLYNWAAAMNGASGSLSNPSGVQGVCPDGWHVPSDAEWTDLSTYLGGLNVAGGKLKASGTDYWTSPNTGATNESGFGALPGGVRGGYIKFDGLGEWGHFITSTPDENFGTAYVRSVSHDGASLIRWADSITFGASVRCVKGQGYAVPAVTTSVTSAIIDTIALAGGNVTDDGGQTVTARGLCWSFGLHPNLERNDGVSVEGTGTGSFTDMMSGLIPDTIYSYRAYATNSVGTGYGEILNFRTEASDLNGQTGTLTDYDGNTYDWIGIGTQVWMAENLKTTHYADGSAIPLMEGSTAWDALGYSDKAYCWYDNSTTNRDEYGGLYTWAAAMNGAVSPSGVQGACPDGWHLPSDEEWTQLTVFLGGQSVAGGKMKETGTDHWYSPNTGATNESGFTALPGGFRDFDGTFLNVGYSGYWWSSSEYVTYDAWYRSLHCTYAGVHRNYYDKGYGISVRCVRDE